MEGWKDGRMERWTISAEHVFLYSIGHPLIKASIAAIDMEDCGPSQPRNPMKTPTLDLVATKSALIARYGVQGFEGFHPSILPSFHPSTLPPFHPCLSQKMLRQPSL